MILIKGELKNNNSMFFTALTTDAASYNLHHDYRGSATREALGAVNSDLEHFCKSNRYAFCLQVYDLWIPKIKKAADDPTPLIRFVAAYDPEKITQEELIKELQGRLNSYEEPKIREITIEEFLNILARAYTRDFIPKDEKHWKNRLHLDVSGSLGLFGPKYFDYKEEIYDEQELSKNAAITKAQSILASKSFLSEIERIYSPGNAKQFYGHPVHYMISAGTWDAAKDMIDIMIPALLTNNRLQSRRVAMLREMLPNASENEFFEDVFSSSAGGTIVVDLSGECSSGGYAKSFLRTVKLIGKQLALQGKNALFIFVDIAKENMFRDENLAEILGNADIVRIEEGFGDKARALQYLDDLVARSDFARFKEDDMAKYLPDRLTFTVTDVYEAFGKWYGRGLKSHIYKAYAEYESVRITVPKPDGKPYRQLQELTGLKEIKQITDRVIAHSKVQMRRHELGLDTSASSRHMVFYGNPGTAKTTVARLLAQILKEEGVLENGHIVECGRQDLVGRYVGWTAKTVEQRFREARGGILFIDEAYSLMDDRSGSYGDEAINTIVQLMENYRDEVIVIFAGYPDRMKDFVDKNEGLASRIAFHLYFPDYTAEEMMDILELMLREHEYSLDKSAKRQCMKIFRAASSIENFGNGRFVRNFLEKAILKQSSRVATEFRGKEIGREEISLIKACDIPTDYHMIQDKDRSERSRIGFVPSDL